MLSDKTSIEINISTNQISIAGRASESIINSDKELTTRTVYHLYFESCIKAVGCTNKKVRARQLMAKITFSLDFPKIHGGAKGP